MDKIQRRYVKFRTDSLDIKEVGFNLSEEDGYTILEVEWKFIEPFYLLEKNPTEYYPVISEQTVKGFRRKELFEASIVKNEDDDVIRALRSFENF